MKKTRPHHTIPFESNTQEHYLFQLHAMISDYFILTGKPSPRSLSNAKELALAVLDRLYANERALKEIRDILQKNVR